MSAIDDFLSVPTNPDYEAIGEKAGLPKGLFPKVIATESGGRPFAVSPKGAEGAAQVMPATGKQYGKNPWDPSTGATILADYIKKAGSIEGGLAMYNTGSPDVKTDAAKKYIAQVGFTPEAKDPKDAFLEGATNVSPLAKAPPQKPQAPQAPQTPTQVVQQRAQKSPEDLEKDFYKLQNGTAHERAQQAISRFNYDDMMKNDPGFRAVVNAAFPDVPLGAVGTLASKVGSAAFGKMLQTQLGQQLMQRYKAGQAAGTLAQDLIKHDRASVAREVALKRDNDQFFADNPHYKEFDEEVYHAGEDDNIKLSPEATYYKKTYLDPRKQVFDAYVQEAKRLGVKLPADMVDLDRYMHRQYIQPQAKKSVFKLAQDIIDPNEMLVNHPTTRGFSRSPDIFQTPNAGTVQSSLTGERGGYMIDPDSSIVDVYKNGKVIDKGTIVDLPNGGKAIATKNGGLWDMDRGTTKEIEQHTPARYFKSAAASLTEAQTQIADTVANAKFLKALQSSPDFLKYARPEGATFPRNENWRTVDIPGYSGFNGWHFKPQMADVLDDYTGTKMDTNSLMQGINRIVQGSIFLDPLKHLFNVQFHAAMQAGLFGGVVRSMQGGVRLITPGEQTLTRQAVMGVINKDPKYLQYVKESAGLRGANNAVQDYGNHLLKQMGKDPNQLNGMAKMLGYGTGANFVRAAYRGSNSTLWGVGDMILYKSFLASEIEHPGATKSEIAELVGKHVPTYVVPSTILGSRSFSKLVQQPWFLGFSRYEYNRAASYGNLLKGLIKPEQLEQNGQSMDQIASLIFHTAITYPMVNHAIEKMTGNPNASLGWYGPFSYIGAAEDYKSGKKNFAQATMQTAVRPSAATEMAAEMLYGKELWKDGGKSIYHSSGDFGKYLMTKTYPTQAIERVINPPKGVTPKRAVRQFALDFLGIKDPTPAQEATIQKYANLEMKRRQKP